MSRRDTAILEDGTSALVCWITTVSEHCNKQARWEDQDKPERAGCLILWTKPDLDDDQLDEVERILMED